MSYRSNKTYVSISEFTKSVDSISRDVLGIGYHTVVIEDVVYDDELVIVSFTNTKTTLRTKIGSSLYNGLLSATLYEDTEALWEVANERSFDLLKGQRVRVKIGISRGHGIVKKNNEYHVVKYPELSVVKSTKFYNEARDYISTDRCWLNIIECSPPDRLQASEIRTANNRRKLFGKRI